ncbi:MAG: arsenate reductase (glutaredoxin) [Stellaceae bacterium]
MPVVFYHNPRCRTSRAALDLLRKKGVEPRIIEYLKTPPSAAELKRLLKMLGLKPRELLRKKEAKEAGLDKASLSDDAVIAGMVKHPIAIERPIAVNGSKAALGRPPERVLEIL